MWSQIGLNRDKIERVSIIDEPEKGYVARSIYQADKKKVLDIGASYGELKIQLDKLNYSGMYHSFDIDTHVKADFRSYDEITGTYDVVTILQVLEHVPLETAVEILTHAKHFLNDGGWLYVGVPDPSHPTWQRQDITHVQHYPMKDLAAVLSLLGFEKIEVWRIAYFPVSEKGPAFVHYMYKKVGQFTRYALTQLTAVNFESRSYILRCAKRHE